VECYLRCIWFYCSVKYDGVRRRSPCSVDVLSSSLEVVVHGRCADRFEDNSQWYPLVAGKDFSLYVVQERISQRCVEVGGGVVAS
jgi:hypothetical protein